MIQAGWRSSLVVLTFSAAALAACQSGQKAPPRFSAEMYNDCTAIKRVWEADYARLAKRRFTSGQNVFLYNSPPDGGLAIYDGLHDAEWELTDDARAAIAKGGSWGVTYPDTGCPNISFEMGELYMERYNQFALTLYAGRRRTPSKNSDRIR